MLCDQFDYSQQLFLESSTPLKALEMRRDLLQVHVLSYYNHGNHLESGDPHSAKVRLVPDILHFVQSI